MGVFHSENLDPVDLLPVQSAIRLQRWRVIRRSEEEPIGVVKIYRQIPLQFAFQFVTASLGKGSHDSQVVCGG